jgi:hypothetical protein
MWRQYFGKKNKQFIQHISINTVGLTAAPGVQMAKTAQGSSHWLLSTNTILISHDTQNSP